MVILYWWLLLVWVLVVAILVWAYRRRYLARLVRQQPPIRVAHSARLINLPEYKNLRKQYRFRIALLLGLFVVGTLSAMLLTARPASQSVVTPAQLNRDIMLCLDISGSMTKVDVEIIETFEELVGRYKGQRIGLEIFNSVGVQIFPLTDDYELVKSQLATMKKLIEAYSKNDWMSVMKSEEIAFISGTYGAGDAPNSNAGLGLASCVQHLGENLTKRSQSVILATDNELSGDEKKVIITTAEAMMLAKQKNVRVYAVDPGPYSDSTVGSTRDSADNSKGEHGTLKTYAILTGGGYYRLSSGGLVSDIIQKISTQEAQLFVGDSQYAVSDSPLPAFIVLVLSVFGMTLLTWRLKL